MSERKILHSGSFIDRKNNGIRVTFYNEERDIPGPTPPTPSVLVYADPTMIEMDAVGGGWYVSVWASDGSDVYLTESLDWVSTSLWRQQGDKKTYYVQIDRNDGGERQGVVYASNGIASTSILIKQEGNTVRGLKWVAVSHNIQIVDGGNIWNDALAQHTYYSLGSEQYELLTGGWVDKEWDDPHPNQGYQVWNDGNDTYLCRYSTIYKLEDGIWNEVESRSMDAKYVWHDLNGETYYSNGTKQWIWDNVNQTFENKTWEGISPYYGSKIWNDGTHLYYSSGNTQYIYNEDTGWVAFAWAGYFRPEGDDVWYYKGHIYCEGKELKDGVWVEAEWLGDIRPLTFVKYSYWKDGEGHQYYSSPNEQYELIEVYE